MDQVYLPLWRMEILREQAKRRALRTQEEARKAQRDLEHLDELINLRRKEER